MTSIRFLRYLLLIPAAVAGVLITVGCSGNQVMFNTSHESETAIIQACGAAQIEFFGELKTPDMRAKRYTGKASESEVMCRGGIQAMQFRGTPWVDWGNYWGTGGLESLPNTPVISELRRNRGVTGAIFDLERQRIALIKFNLFDNSGTYPDYVNGVNGRAGPSVKVWPQMRLQPSNPLYGAVGGNGTQECKGELIRWRTVTGICNDILNPAMGSTGMPFMRNVEFESSFPDLGLDSLTRNRHGDRIKNLLVPDPQVISRRLFTRVQSAPDKCNNGYGLPGDSKDAQCDYQAASFFNVLAAYWIQFMTHDWFSHLEDGHNAPAYMPTGCATKLVNNVPVPLTPDEVKALGCRPDDQIDKSYVAEDGPPNTFTTADGKEHMARAPKTSLNTNTAWWDASQIYGFDDTSSQRVKRDPADTAKLLLVPVGGQSGPRYLPVFSPNDPINPEWAGQEATAFPDNWTVGLSFLHNLFAREHNSFVDEFRRTAAETPDADSGLRDPANPKQVIRYKDVTPDVLFEVARLVVAAEIAKIHTTEWTPQLLYNDPLYIGMNGNWSGLLGADFPALKNVLRDIVKSNGNSTDPAKATAWYSVLASGPGIFGLGSTAPGYDITNPTFTNGGVNHFGAPFNFPEEFVSVYRLHPLVPDLLEYRDLSSDPNKIAKRIPVVETFQGNATPFTHNMGMANWALTLGRQRLGLLTLNNSPLFLQNLKLGRLESNTQQLDVLALDIIRDREHGVPRFNEFRRQYGLRQLTSFDDFIDPGTKPGSQERIAQETAVRTLRELYGQHTCDASKVITDAQLNDDGTSINDCLGHPTGTLVDNIEDVDTAVGYLAEFRRPHGFAISETQFVVFILNASRRLFSDRFLTSGFRPEFYSYLGIDWVNYNGPRKDAQLEKGAPNGHPQPVSPMKRILLRNIPELAPELAPVINAFDPWARDRGQYYSLCWKPRPGAEQDESFKDNPACASLKSDSKPETKPL
jgi:hypothetical protein